MKRRWLLAGTLLAGLATTAHASDDRPVPGPSTEAIRIARESQPGWALGRLVVKTRGQRPPRVEAEVLAGMAVVARLRVDPATGALLPHDRRATRDARAQDESRLRAAVARAVREIEIGGWAWPVEHGRAWGVPLRHDGRVVGAVRVDARARRLLAAEPDDEDDD